MEKSIEKSIEKSGEMLEAFPVGCRSDSLWFYVILQGLNMVLHEAASPFADKERNDWQIPAWKRHCKKWSKTHRVSPRPLLMLSVQFQPVHRNDPCLLAQKAWKREMQFTSSQFSWTWLYRSEDECRQVDFRKFGRFAVHQHAISTVCKSLGAASAQPERCNNHFFQSPRTWRCLEWHSREHSWRREHQVHCTGRPRGKCYWSGASDSNMDLIGHPSW